MCLNRDNKEIAKQSSKSEWIDRKEASRLISVDEMIFLKSKA